MQKYYFHVRNGNGSFKDTEGSFHPSLEKACSEAMRIASELARDEQVCADHVVCVVDPEGYEVAIVPVHMPAA
jgi:hypothetical protein